MNKAEHEQAVYDFLKNAAREQPILFRELSDRYPILSGNRIRRLRKREQCVGLIGLQPVRLPTDILSQHDLDGFADD